VEGDEGNARSGPWFYPTAVQLLLARCGNLVGLRVSVASSVVGVCFPAAFVPAAWADLLFHNSQNKNHNSQSRLQNSQNSQSTQVSTIDRKWIENFGRNRRQYEDINILLF
jgi:hypothetical protein